MYGGSLAGTLRRIAALNQKASRACLSGLGAGPLVICKAGQTGFMFCGQALRAVTILRDSAFSIDWI